MYTHNLDPVLFDFGFVVLRWYSLAYILGIIFGWWLGKKIAKKLLSTNNEKWNTIPRTYAEIDTLREKFQRENNQDKLVILDEINAYVEELEKTYSKV